MTIKTVAIICIALTSFSLQSQNNYLTVFESSGGLETPRYDETYRYCRMLSDSSAMVSMIEYGKSPQGRILFAMILDREGLSDPVMIRSRGRIIMMVEACIHPGEPEGKDAGLLLLRDITINKENISLTDNVSILFIPIANPDGHERFGSYNRVNQNGPKEMGWRTTAVNLNLNRDFLKADAPEMQAWLKLFNTWLPDFFMDIHTTNGADYQYVITYGAEDFGNMDGGLTLWIDKTYIPTVSGAMEADGLPIFPYVTFIRWHDPSSGLRSRASGPRFSQGYVAARNRPGILVETHMLKPYPQRVKATLTLMIHTLKILNDQHKTLTTLNKNADLHCISGALLRNPFSLSYKLTEKSVPVEFKGVKYHSVTSDITGNEWFIYSDTPYTFTLDWYRENVPERLVILPEAYIIPAEWSEVIHRLALHGIEMEQLRRDSTLEVSLYRFSEVRFGSLPNEGRMRVENFKVEEFRKTVTYPPGSVVINIKQQGARIIAHALEPGSPDSFLQWGYFNAIFEQKEYGESYVMEKMFREMISQNPALSDEFKVFSETLLDGPSKMWAQYNWIFSRTPYYDTTKDVYPVGRIIK